HPQSIAADKTRSSSSRRRPLPLRHPGGCSLLCKELKNRFIPVPVLSGDQPKPWRYFSRSGRNSFGFIGLLFVVKPGNSCSTTCKYPAAATGLAAYESPNEMRLIFVAAPGFAMRVCFQLLNFIVCFYP